MNYNTFTNYYNTKMNCEETNIIYFIICRCYLEK